MLPASTDPDASTGETSSLMSHSSDPTEADEDRARSDSAAHNSHDIDVRGLAMFRHLEFYHLVLLLGMLTGVGLMTIK